MATIRDYSLCFLENRDHQQQLNAVAFLVRICCIYYEDCKFENYQICFLLNACESPPPI